MRRHSKYISIIFFILFLWKSGISASPQTEACILEEIEEAKMGAFNAFPYARLIKSSGKINPYEWKCYALKVTKVRSNVLQATTQEQRLLGTNWCISIKMEALRLLP